jgi:pyrimidine deaminase RibD-like protein
MRRRALQLAECGVGHTHPNPAVGSVIVLNGEARPLRCLAGMLWLA